jgi:hypothetical protein
MDRVDNDGDAAVDFPNDPGCSDFTDPSENSELAPRPPGDPGSSSGDEPTPTRPRRKPKKDGRTESASGLCRLAPRAIPKLLKRLLREALRAAEPDHRRRRRR